MAITTPVDTVNQLYAAFAAQDVEGALALLHPEILITEDPALPWGGRFEGKDRAVEFFLGLVGNIESTVTAAAVYAAGDRVVQYGRTAGTVVATGAEFDVAECHIFGFRDGLVAELAIHIDSEAMLAALAR